MSESKTGISPENVVGIGIDFTACTMLPVKRDGTPLCALAEYRHHPHAWVKLWKHHAAQPKADKINATARELRERWIDRYGGKISSEWFFAKTLQMLDEAPDIYGAADRLIEAADWVVWQLTGEETRNSCTAGYKAMWSKREGFPECAFFKALDPRLERVVDEKMSRAVFPMGDKAGGLTARAAEWTGLTEGTAVAVANVEAFEKNGVSVNELVACGGLPEKNKMLMQIYADVTGRPLKISASQQTPALGSAMFGAVAAGRSAGGYDTIFEAVRHMARLKDEAYRPIAENQKTYARLYAEYVRLHDYFGRGENNVMKTLKQIRDKAGFYDRQ